MKFAKITILLLVALLFLAIPQIKVFAEGEAVVIDADSVWSSSLTPASSDVLDSTDAPTQNLIKYAFVSHADSVWNAGLSSASSDVLDSTDAPSGNLIKYAFVSHADSVLNIGLEPGEWEIKPDFWIENIRPVQVVWGPDINDDGRIDLVTGKSTMVRLEIGMENYETLDKDTQLEIKLFLPEPSGDFIIPKTYTYTIEQLIAMNKKIDVYLDFDLPLRDHTITAKIYPPSEIKESDLSNNENSTNITVKNTYDLDIRYFKIKPPEDSETHKPLYKPVEKYEETAEKNSEFFQAVYPLADGMVYPISENTIRKEPIIGNKIPSEEGIKRDAVEISNQAKRLGADRGVGIVSFGPLDDYFRYHGSTAGGMAFRGVEGVIVGDHLWTTAAHEIGHTYNLYLPPCLNWPPWECEEADLYPPDGRPANGFWVTRQEEIKNRICFMGETNDYEKFDDTWVCNKCYEDLFRKLRMDKKDPEILILSGIIYRDNSIELGKWYRVKEGKDDLDTIIPGDYSIQILDENKNILEEVSFLIEFLETDSQPFSFAVPYPQGAFMVRIFYQNQILAEFNLTQHLFSSAIDTLSSDYDMLIEGIKEASIQQGIKNSLTSKLTNAKKKAEQGIAYIREGQTKKAENMLNSASNMIQAFINEVNAQKGKKVSEEDANEFVEWAERMILTLQNQIIETLQNK